MDTKQELINKYLSLFKIDFNLENARLVDFYNESDKIIKYLGYYIYEKKNKDNKIILRKNKNIILNISDNIVTINYVNIEDNNYRLENTNLKYRWLTTIENKIIYLIKDNDKLTIINGNNREITLKDDYGNMFNKIKDINSLEDIESVETSSINIYKNFSLIEDVDLLRKMRFKNKVYSLYKIKKKS